MGALGDKFKKLAGDQTRQLLQNFQNAQSSKTRNGYSYGKLNEDGTATLADGTVVQTVVKGRPGQYAPVFNLGNGQGLVDQPEAKFFTVDSNNDSPFSLVVGWTNIESENEKSIAIKGIWIVDRLGNKYNLPPEYYPDTLPSMSLDTSPPFGFPSFYATACAGFGGFSILFYCGQYIKNTKSNTSPGPPPEFPNASFITVNSFSLQEGNIIPQEESYQTGSISYNSFLDNATEQYSFSFPERSVINSSIECTSGYNEVVTLNNYIPNPYGSSTYTVVLRLMLRGTSKDGLIVDLSVLGQTRFNRGLASINQSYSSVLRYPLSDGGDYNREGVYSLVENPRSSSLYDVELLYTNYTITTTGGFSNSGTDHLDPIIRTSTLVGLTCFLQGPTGPTEFGVGGRQFSKIVKNWQTAPETTTLSTYDYNPAFTTPALDLPAVVAVIPTQDPEDYKSIVNDLDIYNQSPGGFTVSLRDKYSPTILYSTLIDFYFVLGDLSGYPVGYNEGPVLYGTGGVEDGGGGGGGITAPIYLNKRGFSFGDFNGVYIDYLNLYRGYPISGYGAAFNFYNLRVDGQQYYITKTYESGVTPQDLFPIRDPSNEYYTYTFGYR